MEKVISACNERTNEEAVKRLLSFIASAIEMNLHSNAELEQCIQFCVKALEALSTAETIQRNCWYF